MFLSLIAISGLFFGHGLGAPSSEVTASAECSMHLGNQGNFDLADHNVSLVVMGQGEDENGMVLVEPGQTIRLMLFGETFTKFIVQVSVK